MGIEIQAWAWRQPLAPATKLVFVKLAESANDETGECWPSLRHVANRCNMAQNTVRFHIRKLKESGLIQVIERHREDGTQTSNLYKILTPTYQDLDTYPPMDGRGTLQPIAPLEPELEPKKNLLTEDSLYIAHGEFQNVKLTAGQYEKLKARLNGMLDGLIDRLDQWGEKYPAKFRKNKSHYATILNWANDGGDHGKPNESETQRRQRATNEAGDALLRRVDEKTRNRV